MSVRIHSGHATERVASECFVLCFSSHLCPFLNHMKPTVIEDEFEDAEEENKFINEVCIPDKLLATTTRQLLSSL